MRKLLWILLAAMLGFLFANCFFYWKTSNPINALAAAVNLFTATFLLIVQFQTR